MLLLMDWHRVAASGLMCVKQRCEGIHSTSLSGVFCVIVPVRMHVRMVCGASVTRSPTTAAYPVRRLGLLGYHARY